MVGSAHGEAQTLSPWLVVRHVAPGSVHPSLQGPYGSTIVPAEELSLAIGPLDAGSVVPLSPAELVPSAIAAVDASLNASLDPPVPPIVRLELVLPPLPLVDPLVVVGPVDDVEASPGAVHWPLDGPENSP